METLTVSLSTAKGTKCYNEHVEPSTGPGFFHRFHHLLLQYNSRTKKSRERLRPFLTHLRGAGVTEWAAPGTAARAAPWAGLTALIPLPTICRTGPGPALKEVTGQGGEDHLSS